MCARQKTDRKHTKKKAQPPLSTAVPSRSPTAKPPPNAPAPVAAELFPASHGSRPIASPWATPAQIFPDGQFDDPALRRLDRDLNPATGAPWIPKPRGGRWEVIPTLRGIIAWQAHQRATADTRTLPAQCASMRDVAAVYQFPIEMLQYAREHYHPQVGAPVIFESSNRVNVPPFLAFMAPLWKKIFCKGSSAIAGLENFEEIDLDTQRAKSAAEDVIAKKFQNGQTAKTLHTRDGVERELGEPLTAIATDWKSFEKITGGKLKSLLHGAGVAPEIVRQAITIAAAGIQEPMSKLRQLLKLDQPAPPEPASSVAAEKAA